MGQTHLALFWDWTLQLVHDLIRPLFRTVSVMPILRLHTALPHTAPYTRHLEECLQCQSWMTKQDTSHNTLQSAFHPKNLGALIGKRKALGPGPTQLFLMSHLTRWWKRRIKRNCFRATSLLWLYFISKVIFFICLLKVAYQKFLKWKLYSLTLFQ